MNTLVPGNFIDSCRETSSSIPSKDALDLPAANSVHQAESSTATIGAAISRKIVLWRTEVREQYARNRIHSGSTMLLFRMRGVIEARPANKRTMKSYSSSDRKTGDLNSDTFTTIQLDRSVSRM